MVRPRWSWSNSSFPSHDSLLSPLDEGATLSSLTWPLITCTGSRLILTIEDPPLCAPRGALQPITHSSTFDKDTVLFSCEIKWPECPATVCSIYRDAPLTCIENRLATVICWACTCPAEAAEVSVSFFSSRGLLLTASSSRAHESHSLTHSHSPAHGFTPHASTHTLSHTQSVLCKCVAGCAAVHLLLSLCLSLSPHSVPPSLSHSITLSAPWLRPFPSAPPPDQSQPCFLIQHGSTLSTVPCWQPERLTGCSGAH